MDYALAKELRAAGYPVLLRFDGFKNVEPTVIPPTLTELIEACDRDFDTMTRSYTSGGWIASNFGATRNGTGKTAEEAVARLWLALNKRPSSTEDIAT